MALPTPRSQTSRLHNYGRVHFCCFQLPVCDSCPRHLETAAVPESRAGAGVLRPLGSRPWQWEDGSQGADTQCLGPRLGHQWGACVTSSPEGSLRDPALGTHRVLP